MLRQPSFTYEEIYDDSIGKTLKASDILGKSFYLEDYILRLIDLTANIV